MSHGIKIDRDAVYDIGDAATVCHQTMAAVQAAVRSGELPATRRGRRTYVTGESLWRWLTGRPRECEADR